MTGFHELLVQSRDVAVLCELAFMRRGRSSCTMSTRGSWWHAHSVLQCGVHKTCTHSDIVCYLACHFGPVIMCDCLVVLPSPHRTCSVATPHGSTSQMTPRERYGKLYFSSSFLPCACMCKPIGLAQFVVVMRGCAASWALLPVPLQLAVPPRIHPSMPACTPCFSCGSLVCSCIRCPCPR